MGHGDGAARLHDRGCGDGGGEPDGEPARRRTPTWCRLANIVLGGSGASPDGDGDAGGEPVGHGDDHGDGERWRAHRGGYICGQCQLRSDWHTVVYQQ